MRSPSLDEMRRLTTLMPVSQQPSQVSSPGSSTSSSATSCLSQYRYESLADADTYIRLLVLLPGDFDYQLTGGLLSIKLEEAAGYYKTLSYE